MTVDECLECLDVVLSSLDVDQDLKDSILDQCKTKLLIKSSIDAIDRDAKRLSQLSPREKLQIDADEFVDMYRKDRSTSSEINLLSEGYIVPSPPVGLIDVTAVEFGVQYHKDILSRVKNESDDKTEEE